MKKKSIKKTCFSFCMFFLLSLLITTPRRVAQDRSNNVGRSYKNISIASNFIVYKMDILKLQFRCTASLINNAFKTS